MDVILRFYSFESGCSIIKMSSVL